MHISCLVHKLNPISFHPLTCDASCLNTFFVNIYLGVFMYLSVIQIFFPLL